MNKKLTDYRTPFSLLNWIQSRNKRFGRYILFSVAEAEEKDIQNSSIVLLDKEYPIFECYGTDPSNKNTYLLITTHFLTSIIDNETYKVDIEEISFEIEIDDIIENRKVRTKYIEYVCYELRTTQGIIIPVWIENGICEHILWGIFNQLIFLKRKYRIITD